MIYFTPGPSEIYFTVPDHLKRAFREGIPSISHRSKQFENIFSQTTGSLRELLGIPSDFVIAFVSSATEIWERSLQSLASEKSFHLVNGAFSKKYFEVAGQLKVKAEKIQVKSGEGFSAVTIPRGSELIAVTHNETSTGVSTSLDLIHSLREQAPDSLIIVDAVSSLPYPAFDFSKIDSVFFSVQKGFGLPAGLGVWAFSQRCVERAEKLVSTGHMTGTHHSVSSLASFAKKNQTPSTPNVLGIYLLGQVANDFLVRGINTIRKETEYKAAVLYQALEKRTDIRPFVRTNADRSMTVITVDCGTRLVELSAYLSAKNFQLGEGYGEFKDQHLRIANFPAHSKEQVEALADAIEGFQ